MSRRISYSADAMMGAISLCVLIASLSIVSGDVRTQVVNAITGDPAGELNMLGLRAQAFWHTLARTAADYRMDDAPLIGFSVIAVALFVLMFRS